MSETNLFTGLYLNGESLLRKLKQHQPENLELVYVGDKEYTILALKYAALTDKKLNLATAGKPFYKVLEALAIALSCELNILLIRNYIEMEKRKGDRWQVDAKEFFNYHSIAGEVNLDEIVAALQGVYRARFLYIQGIAHDFNGTDVTVFPIPPKYFTSVEPEFYTLYCTDGEGLSHALIDAGVNKLSNLKHCAYKLAEMCKIPLTLILPEEPTCLSITKS